MKGPPYATLYYSLIRDARISASEKVVMLALQEWGWKHHECYMAASTVAERSGLSERTVKYSLKHLEELGLIKRVPDKSKRTGRKFLLLWLDDKTYLPPLRKPREKPRRAAKPTREETCKLTEDQIREAARKEVGQLAEEGWAEEAVYDRLGQGLRELNPSDEQFEWHEQAWMEAMRSAFPGSPCPDEVPWKPGDPGKPDQFQVAQWVLVRLGEAMAAAPDVDCPEEDLYSELSSSSCDDEVWAWAEAAIKQLNSRLLSGAESSSPGP
jgi:DNA-binding transcriptional regulator GbsR (MarR family)